MSDNNIPKRYRAFISYSHKDERHANWLQQALESYRLPKHLIGRVTSEGKITARFGKVFRDRTDLSVAPDLGEQLQGTLGQSRNLLVICSPAAAQSKWVNEEILYFKRQYSEARILALIVDGEPFASSKGEPERECLPPALRFRLNRAGDLSEEPAEPLASDLRPEGDGKRLALLKLMAAMLGLGLDELVQRDHQRRLRVQKLITAAALIGVTVLSGLTYMALSARDLAEERRLAAEDLINFMLTDLRDKLEPVGRLDVLDVVGEKVLDFYAIQDNSQLNADALSRQAAAMHLLGEIHDLSGDADSAIKLFTRAAEMTGELLDRDPESPQRIFDHAQSVFWVGYPDYQRGNYVKAEYWFDQYLQLAEKLVRKEPKNTKWQLELAYALSSQAILRRFRARLEEALELFEREKLVLGELLVSDDVREARINNLAWIASAQRALGLFNLAINSRIEELKMIDSWMQEEPGRSNLLDHVIVAENELILLYGVVGDEAGRDKYMVQGKKTADKLLSLDEENKNNMVRAHTFRLDSMVVSEESLIESEGLLRDVRLIANEMPLNFDAQLLLWKAELVLGLKLHVGGGVSDLLSLAREFLVWSSNHSGVDQQRHIQPISVIANLILLADPKIDISSRLEKVKQAIKYSSQSKDFLNLSVFCPSESLEVLLVEEEVDVNFVISTIKGCVSPGSSESEAFQPFARSN